MKKVVLWINSFLLCFIVSLFVLNFYAFNRGFYSAEFSKNGVYEKMPEADAMAGDLAGYFLGKEKLAFAGSYSAEELIHLADVKALFFREFLVFSAVLVLFAALMIFQYLIGGKLSRTVVLGSIIGLAVSAILSVVAVFFDSSFVAFHKLLFSNSYWLLPEGSTLITLFPRQFFVDFFVSVIVLKLAISAAMLALCLGLRYRRQIRKYINKIAEYNKK